MKPSDLKAGDEILVQAKVLRARGTDDGEPAYQGADLQLPDGQLLQTNLINLVEPAKPELQTKAVAGPPEDKAIKTAPKTK